MKPSFTPVIIPSQKKSDGTYNVKIRVTYKRKSKRLSTNLHATANDLTRSLNFKETPLKKAAYDLAEKFRNICSDIDYFDLQKMEVEDVVRYIDAKEASSEKFNLDFIAYMREKAKTKGPSEINYKTAANCLERFMRGRTLDVNDINVRFLRDFETFICNEPKLASVFKKKGDKFTKESKDSGRAANLYIGSVRHIHKLARMEFNEPDMNIYRIPNNPFEYYTPPKPPNPKRRNKSQEFIQMMINESAKAKGIRKFAMEVFILSFALEGMNLADLYSCPPAKGRWLVYNRRKTAKRRADNAEHHVYIPDQIMPLVEKMRDKEDSGYMFSFHKRYISHKSFTNNANLAMRTWRKDCKIESFTMYSARHSFASIARKAGVEKATIDEMLCHVGDLKMADVYIEPDWDIHRKANNKVLELFDWSPIQ